MNKETILEEVRLTALKGSSVSSFRGKVNQYLPVDSWMEVEDEDFLYDINVTGLNSKGKKRVRLAGLLMLGEASEIEAILPEYMLSYTEYDSAGKVVKKFSTKDAGAPENYYDFHSEVYDRLSDGLRTNYSLIVHGQDSLGYTHLVLRELLAKVLVAAEFDNKGGVTIEKYPDKLVYSFPGVMDKIVTEPIRALSDEVGMGTMVRLFNLLGYLEPKEQKMKGMFDIWSKQGWKTPSVDVSSQAKRVTITLPLK